MRLTITIPHGGPLATPSIIKDMAQAVEGYGFDGIGFFDHLALPRSVASEYNLTPSPVGIPDDNLKKTLTPLYECVSTMAYVAGVTERVRMTTGILVLPLRNPIYNARQLATIDALSGGRLNLGIGVGWLKEEADAMQMPWDARGARTDEHMEILRLLWTSDEEYVSYHGKYYQFEEIDPKPHPEQRPIPILIGGHADVAKKRAGRLGDGWITSKLALGPQEQGMEDVRAIAREAGRDPDTLQWFAQTEARFENGGVKSPDELFALLRGYRDLGLTDTSIRAMARTREDTFTLLKWLAEEVLPEFR